MPSGARPTIRLLFDELASPRVARALNELGFSVHHVGGDDQPPKGSEDEVLLEHAKRTNQTIVTNNHDMIVLCCESLESVIWLDPRDKDMTLTAQTLLCFGQIGAWQDLLREAREPVCVRARKTKCETLPLDRAQRIAIERGKRRRRSYARSRPGRIEGDPIPGLEDHGSQR